MAPGRMQAIARRKAQSGRGKAAQANGRSTAAAAARDINPGLSGRDVARQVRAQRSSNGGAGEPKSAPCGRVRPRPESAAGAAEDASWKVGASHTTHGQTVTGTMVGRSVRVTGDEPSTCRSITGTEYLGAEQVASFCGTAPAASPSKVQVTATGSGRPVTGNEVGRSSMVTGDEPGTCKNVTGTDYLPAGQVQAFCGTTASPAPAKISVSSSTGGQSVTGSNVGRSAKVTGDEAGAERMPTGTQYMPTGSGTPAPKVGMTQTFRGGSVTGTRVGRSARVTGDEPGSCKTITGNEYVGSEQYSGFCSTSPVPSPAKVGLSTTFKGKPMTGTQTGRSGLVTGNEPGTCKAVTGTPYAGVEQYGELCETAPRSEAMARTRPLRMTPGADLTGQQPGINGVLTGAERGACEPVTGTPYVGSDQYAQSCGTAPAYPGGADYPRALDGAPWSTFSVTSPARAAHQLSEAGGVTGTRYEDGHITGPFDMGLGKVTGTEQFRFGGSEQAVAAAAPPPAEAPEVIGGRPKSRITGEGMDTGLRITGDDWDRGEHVTGTEGHSATRRNPTRRGGPMSAMPPMGASVPVTDGEIPVPENRITGSSGATERGALITVSGGARG